MHKEEFGIRHSGRKSPVTSFTHCSIIMTVIRDLKTNFSSIAWCPVKEHASVMIVANMKDLTPMPSESSKMISLYDWHLENVEESKTLVEVQLPAGVCCLNWSNAVVTGAENAQGLISVGMVNGSIDFYVPLFSQEMGWALQKVLLSAFP